MSSEWLPRIYECGVRCTFVCTSLFVLCGWSGGLCSVWRGTGTGDSHQSSDDDHGQQRAKCEVVTRYPPTDQLRIEKTLSILAFGTTATLDCRLQSLLLIAYPTCEVI